MTGKKKKIRKMNDRQYSEYIALLRAKDEEAERDNSDG